MDFLVASIRERYQQTLDRIAAAERASGRAPGSTRLVVVTKSQPLEVVKAALGAGVKILGENYAEEAKAKMDAIGSRPGMEWHMIGHVQSRKAHLIPVNFSLMHSLDSLKLANRLERFAAEAGITLPVLLELNVGGEVSKYGWRAVNELQWANLLPEVEAVLKLENLSVRGLMTMPPLEEDPRKTRPYFERLRRLRDYLAVRFPQVEWRELSMGTSVDFEAAVAEGATLVRVGTAILGPRPPKVGNDAR
jgi:hypothetical protein